MERKKAEEAAQLVSDIASAVLSDSKQDPEWRTDTVSPLREKLATLLASP